MGLYFLHEHPAYASSWLDPEVKRLLAKPDESGGPGTCGCVWDVLEVAGDTVLVKKPTAFMTNTPAMGMPLGVGLARDVLGSADISR